MKLSFKTLSTFNVDLLSAIAPYQNEFFLRNATEADQAILKDLFAQGRYGDPSVLPETLLQQQWQLRQQIYKNEYPNYLTLVVLQADEVAGMVTVSENVCTLHILELILKPHVRSQGWGSLLLRGLQATAALRGQTLSLHVLPHNPALRLYRRLGFAERGSDGMQLHLEWTFQGEGGVLNKKS